MSDNSSGNPNGRHRESEARVSSSHVYREARMCRARVKTATVARSKARKTSGSRGSVRPSNREMEETFLFSSAFVRKIVVSFEIEGWARSLVSGLDIRRLRSAKDRTSSDKFNLRVRVSVRVTRRRDVAANKRTKSVGESKGGESTKLKLGELNVRERVRTVRIRRRDRGREWKGGNR